MTILNASGLIVAPNIESISTMKAIVWLLICLNSYFYIKLYSSVYFNYNKMYMMGILVFVFSFIIGTSIISLILCIKLIIDSIKICNKKPNKD